MKTITIKLDNKLERELAILSKEEGQDISTMAVKVLSQGLFERDRRAKAILALDEVFSQQIPPPFDEMTEDEVMKIANKEIQAVRQAH